MTGRIRISGIEVRAKHGVHAAEKVTDQLFLIDLDLGLDVSRAIDTDDLTDTVDYGDIAAKTHRYATSHSFDLIERLAAGIGEMVMESPQVEDVIVTVHKPGAPIEVPFSDVSVSIHMAR